MSPSTLEKISTVDLRSLGIFRILLGFITTYHLCSMFPRIELFYGPLGVFPLAEMKAQTFSFYFLNDSLTFFYLLYFVHLLFSLMLIVGYRTKTAIAINWLLAVSLYNRAPFVSGGGDDILRALLLWSVFLPVEKRFSIDALLNKHQKPIPNSYASVATALLIAQLAMVYWVNGFGKTDPAWCRDFTALYYFFNQILAKPFAETLLDQPKILTFLTFLTLYLERYGVLLLLFPKPDIFRSLAIVIFVIFHWFIDLTLNISWFSWIMIIYWIALIPSSWWDRPKSNPERCPSWPSIQKPANILAILIFILIFTANYFYLSDPETKKIWNESKISKVIRFLALDQKLLKFSQVSPFRIEFEIQPVFEAQSNRNAPYEFDPKPYYQVGNILFLRGNLTERKQRIEHFKNYLKDHWNSQHPQGPRILDVKVILKHNHILPSGNERVAIRTETF